MKFEPVSIPNNSKTDGVRVGYNAGNSRQFIFAEDAAMNQHTHDHNHDHGHAHDHDHDHGRREYEHRPLPTVSEGIDENLLWSHLEESCTWERPLDPEGAERALRYIAATLEAQGLPVTVLECDVYVPAADPDAPGDWRRIRFPVTNIVPDGGAPFFVLAGGHGDASLLEMARLAQKNRNQLSHGLRIAWWNGGGPVGFGPTAWYGDNNFDLLRSRCLAYLSVDQLADRSHLQYQPQATAELADWAKVMVNRLAGQTAEPAPLEKDADGSLLGVGVPSFSFLPVSQANGVEEMDRDQLIERTGFYANALFDLCANPRVPLDVMTIADVFWGELEVLQNGVGDAFDLGQVGEGVKELVVVLEDHEEEDAELEPEVANRKMLDICHLINPVLYTENGPYGHDPGGNRGILPGLRHALAFNRLDPGSAEGKHLRMWLIQESNRICDTMSRAILIARQ
jgi:hypothetical protein